MNLPILEDLAQSQNILIAGAGGGQDILCGLPIYFALRRMGKVVHLANFSFSEFSLVEIVSRTEVIIPNLLIGTRGEIELPLTYFPEGYLARWFREVQGEQVTVWMFAKTGAMQLARTYAKLVERLAIDTLILVDGGVDSLMRGDEEMPGTLLEDSISLTAVANLPLKRKLLACMGFGTEVEENLGHGYALENIAALAKAGAYLGACALTPRMEEYRLYEEACRYVWEHSAPEGISHISSRIIPAVRGEFGNYHLYEHDRNIALYISPLMGLCWFFDAEGVIARSLLVPALRETTSVIHALHTYRQLALKRRPYKTLGYL